MVTSFSHDQEISITTEINTPDRAEFTEQMEERLISLTRDFKEMEIAQMKKGEIEARQKLQKAKQWVSKTRADFQAELDRARKVSDQAWSEVSETLRSSWTEMKESVDRARSEFEDEEAEAKV